MTYDPAFQNTASCKSRITFIDGEKGILRYRGYPIEQLAEKKHVRRDDVSAAQRRAPDRLTAQGVGHKLSIHTMLHENIKKFMGGFRYDAHPMGIFLSTVGALSTFYPEAKRIYDDEARYTQVARLIAKVPSIAGYAYRHSIGEPFVYPDPGLSFVGNFLSMLFKRVEPRYVPNPILERALNVLFILHADHEQNCSTSAMRGIGSSQADPFVSLAGAAAALYGPLQGGANEAALKMLEEIGTIGKIPAFVKKGQGRRRTAHGLWASRLQVV